MIHKLSEQFEENTPNSLRCCGSCELGGSENASNNQENSNHEQNNSKYKCLWLKQWPGKKQIDNLHLIIPCLATIRDLRSIGSPQMKNVQTVLPNHSNFIILCSRVLVFTNTISPLDLKSATLSSFTTLDPISTSLLEVAH